MEVHFRPETESRLQELAAKTGRAPGDLIEDAMAGYLQELSQVCCCSMASVRWTGRLPDRLRDHRLARWRAPLPVPWTNRRRGLLKGHRPDL